MNVESFILTQADTNPWNLCPMDKAEVEKTRAFLFDAGSL